MAVNSKTRVGRTEQISRHFLALRRMLWRHFSVEEPWVLEPVNPDTIGYVWTGEFDLNTLRVDGEILNPKEKVADSKISGYVWTGPKSYYHYLSTQKITVHFNYVPSVLELELCLSWKCTWCFCCIEFWIYLNTCSFLKSILLYRGHKIMFTAFPIQFILYLC